MIFGFINVLKPSGMTSHDVVNWMRKLLGVKRIGHTGTLDPDVAGVLVLAVGQATKLIEYLPEEKKSYRCEITLGLTTDTQDLSGKILKMQEVNEAHLKKFPEICQSFVGKIKQIPPMVSAVRHQGKRLYELAREGVEVERKPREIIIYQLQIVDQFDHTSPSRFLLDVTCSKGTYIRTLCHDIGEKLGCGAAMSYLLRTSSGPFDIFQALTLEEIEELAKNEDYSFIQPVETGIGYLPQVTVKSNWVNPVLNGAKIYPHNLLSINQEINLENLIRIYSPEQKLLAIGSWQKDRRNNFIQVKKVLNRG